MHPTSVPKMGRELYKWVNDLVLPLHNRYLCCVDYYQGILLIDVKKLQYFKYIPLPEEAMHGCRVDEDDPDPARCVSVTGTGFITLVCIDNAIGSQMKTHYAFSIRSWSLIVIHRSTWLYNFTMESDEFWNLCAKNQHLPHVPPVFPLVSLVDPNAISFLLHDHDKDLYWMIEVDVRRKALLSPPALYINTEEEEPWVDRRKPWIFYGHYFIPSWFSSYLDEDPIQSWQRSQMMQKAKQKSTLHKIGRQQQREMLRQEREKLEMTMQKNGLEAESNGSLSAFSSFYAPGSWLQ